jgi:putative DNA primase/helicase
MSAAAVAKALGGKASTTGGFNCRCPLRTHGNGRGDRSPSLHVDDGEDGRVLVHCFAGCDPLDILDELRRRHLLSDRPSSRRQRPSWERTQPAAPSKAPSLASMIWREATTPGVPLTAYLRGRCITGAIPPSIRQGIDLVFGRIPVPVMVVAVQASDRRIVAVERTRLTWEGRKAPVSKPRMKTGRLLDGAVRLAAAGEVLGLAEGVETGLSAMQLAAVPVWASLGSERLGLVRIPEIVRELHVFGDNDDAGRKGADKAAERWAKRGVTVKLRFPPDGVSDWNDYLQARAHAA